MIYLVSNKIDISGLDWVKPLSVDESISMISKWPVVQFDTETTGLNARICELVSMQFGYKDFKTGDTTQIVVDCKSIDPCLYKNVIEHSYLIGHNLKFDLKFLFNYAIVPLRVYDTMICEQVFYIGYRPGKVSFNLHDVLFRNTGIELDKSFQKQIADKGLTPEGIKYAAGDVVYLQDLRKNQIQIAKYRECERALTVENRCVPALAYLEWCGIHLDERKWREKMENDQRELDDCLDRLNEYVRNSTKLNTEFVASYTQPSLFDPDPSTSKPDILVDWSSPKQVIPLVKALGFNTETRDKKTKRTRDSVDEKTLVNQKGIDDEFLKLYFDYKGAAKTVSSYGQGHLNLINPVTGRLHTEFYQIGTTTGRMSSGGKEESDRGKVDSDLARLKGLPEDDVRFVNLQNLPAKGQIGKVTRSCFTAMPGNVFVSCDYSAEESRVSADVWNEKSLLEAFEKDIDTHNLYAKLCFPEELKDVDVRDVKKVRPDLRQAAKSAEFATNYGSNGASIASAIGMPVEKAMEMVSGILKGMPGMADYKKRTGKFLREHGYIVINPVTGHRIYWPEWATWKSVEDRFDRKFWEDYRLYHKGTGDETAQMVKRHMRMGHDWFEKNVLNYPIQGGSAVVVKQAAADLFEWIVRHGYFGKILFCVIVHDEIDCECPEELGDAFSKVISDTMQHAAGMFYKRLPIPASCDVGDHWIH